MVADHISMGAPLERLSWQVYVPGEKRTDRLHATSVEDRERELKPRFSSGWSMKYRLSFASNWHSSP